MVNKFICSLLIEDNEVCAYLNNLFLSELGCEVHIASNAHDAYSFLESRTFDIIFMDIGLPDKDGFTLTSELRNNLKIETPIVAVTGHVFDKSASYFEERGLDGVIYKPASKKDFRNTLKNKLALNTCSKDGKPDSNFENKYIVGSR